MNIFIEELDSNNLWHLVRVLLGAFFMLSGVLKFLSLASFAEVLAGYSLLPEIAIHFFTYGIPAFEFGFGLLLFVAWHVPEISLSLLVLVFVFTILAFTKYLNGQVEDCGCFGKLIERKNNWRDMSPLF